MNDSYVHSLKNLPRLIVFKQVLTYEQVKDIWNNLTNFDEYFNNINFEEHWLQYWNSNGEEIILKKWQQKYFDYLIDNTQNDVVVEEKDKIKEFEVNTENNAEIDSIINKTNDIDITTDDTQHTEDWNTLWQQHSNEIYTEQYNLFSDVYYNFYTHLQNCMVIDNTDTNETIRDIINVRNNRDKLQELGLPIAFGKRGHYTKKRRKKLNDISLHLLFTEDDSNAEEEEEQQGIEEEMDSVIEKNEEILHGTKNKEIKKKKNRKLRNVPQFILEEKNMLKYWKKRFSLFSRYDEGIRLDKESWFSVTPEKIAKHLAERLRYDIIIDGFCGCGGNTIQFAKLCRLVIAIDIDAEKLEMARHNAEIYGVANKIEFIQGDFLQLCRNNQLYGDIVFLSPPWGGPSYKHEKLYDIENCLSPVGATELLVAARNITDNIALFLPKNSNIKQIVKLAGIGNNCEIEHNYLDHRLVALTAFYGNDIIKNT